MVRLARLWPLACILLVLAPMAHAKTPADKFKGKIILSTKPFPARFSSDAAFISHLKKADTKGFKFDEKGKVNIEFMAFFSKAHSVTEFTAKVYDITDMSRPGLVTTFPIYPGQKNLRILASGMTLDAGTFDEEHRYLMVITASYQGPGIAETKFAIKARPHEKVAPTAEVVDFSKPH